METFVGDTITIRVNAGIDISLYDVLWIKFKRPNKTVGHWIASLDPTDHTKMFYNTLNTDLDMSGTWVLEAHVEDPGPIQLHGQFAELTVLDPIAETSSPPTTLGPTTLP